MSATYFGISGAKKNYSGQVRNIVKRGLEYVGDKPCIIGECGIPMDINDKKAFETGDYTHHVNFLDAVLLAMEKNLVNFTLVLSILIYIAKFCILLSFAIYLFFIAIHSFLTC